MYVALHTQTLKAPGHCLTHQVLTGVSSDYVQSVLTIQRCQPLPLALAFPPPLHPLQGAMLLRCGTS